MGADGTAGTRGGCADRERALAGTMMLLLRARSAQQAVLEIVEAAVQAVGGAVSGGVTVVRNDGAIESPAEFGALARRVRRISSIVGEGPGFHDDIHAPTVRVDDFATEQRWPKFTVKVRRLGLVGMLAHALDPGPAARSAVLSLYATEPGAFDRDAAEMTALYAVPVSIALRHAEEIASLQQALLSRQVNGQATGVLMERHRVDGPTAFAMLVQASQRLNVKVREVAQQVARTGQDPAHLRLEDIKR